MVNEAALKVWPFPNEMFIAPACYVHVFVFMQCDSPLHCVCVCVCVPTDGVTVLPDTGHEPARF